MFFTPSQDFWPWIRRRPPIKVGPADLGLEQNLEAVPDEVWAAACRPEYPTVRAVKEAYRDKLDAVRWRVRAAWRRWLIDSTYEGMSDEERAEYAAMKRNALQTLIEKEMERTGDEGMPSFHYPTDGSQLNSQDMKNLPNLPDDVLVRALSGLELCDVFVCGAVCKHWRELSVKALGLLERFEYPLELHALRNRQWLDPDGDICSINMQREWRTVGQCIMEHLTGRCPNLKSIFCDWEVEGDLQKSFIESCPKMEHLHMTLREGNSPWLPKCQGLKSLVLLIPTGFAGMFPEQNWIKDILMEGIRNVYPSLTALGLSTPNETRCSMFNPMEPGPYRALMGFCRDAKAVQLHNVGVINLSDMVPVDGEQLGLVYLSVHGNETEGGVDPEEDICELLGVCPELRVLILGSKVELTDRVIRCMAEHCKKLEKVWLWHGENVVKSICSFLADHPVAHIEFMICENAKVVEDLPRMPANLSFGVGEVPYHFTLRHPSMMRLVHDVWGCSDGEGS